MKLVSFHVNCDKYFTSNILYVHYLCFLQVLVCTKMCKTRQFSNNYHLEKADFIIQYLLLFFEVLEYKQPYIRVIHLL